jgi:multidrug efflux pump subunit AcrA (membrane-fusion protein)
MHAALLALTATCLVGQVSGVRAESPVGSLRIGGCLVTLIDEIEVPAREQGVVTEMAVVEGQHVAEGELLARIDDKQALAVAEVAQYKLEVANEEAGNTVNKQYAEAAAAVALAEYQSAEAANRKAPGSTPQTELNRLLLQHKQFTLQIEQAIYELGIAGTTVKVREAELRAAHEDVARRQVLSPLTGVVEKLYRRKGEWVQPGEPVVKVLRTDSLWVEGWADASRYMPGDLRNRPVIVAVALPGRREQFEGQVVHASDVIQTGHQFLVKAEVKNRQDPRTGDWLLRSGLTGEMAIQLR